MVIGFATSCMNRRWQLEETLPDNLALLRGSKHFIAVCDYNSEDGASEILARFKTEIVDRRLLVFRTDEPRHFHMSAAKNLAHRLALTMSPDVLFNLDADNFLTQSTIEMIESRFGSDVDTCFHNWAATADDGSSGRVALSAQSWMKVGGYDESLLGAAWQDIDLVFRCRALGLHYCRWFDPATTSPIPNNMMQKIQNLAGSVVSSDTTNNDAWRFYAGLRRRNVVTSLGRPIMLDFGEQRRFGGILNFETATTL